MARAWLRAGAWRARARRGKAALATAAIALVSVLQPLAALETGPTCRKGVPRVVYRSNPATAMPVARARPAIWCGLPKPITPVSRPLRGLSRQIASLFLAFQLTSEPHSASSRHFCILPHAPRKACEQLFASAVVPKVSDLHQTQFLALRVANRRSKKAANPGEHLAKTPWQALA